VKLLIWIFIGYVIYRLVKGAGGNKEVTTAEPVGKEVHCDPVCGVYVAVDDAVVGTLEGKKMYFCSMACLEKFREQLENNAPH
jgi:YHS domain-containing protein